ncbi:hypothetical protein OAX78_03460, partial [Planctomycetota bacterium]|nr:hypothetical protein [Planctomycetota bacterium]
ERSGASEEAIASFRRALLLEPTLWRAGLRLAELLFAQERGHDAQNEYERTLRLLEGEIASPERSEAARLCLQRITECRIRLSVAAPGDES